jgi:hypothetical protein
MTTLRSVRHRSRNVAAIVVARGSTKLEDVTTQSPRSYESLQRGKRRPESIKTRALDFLQKYICVLAGCDITANLWDRNGGVRSNKVQRGCFRTYMVRRSYFDDGIRAENVEPLTGERCWSSRCAESIHSIWKWWSSLYPLDDFIVRPAFRGRGLLRCIGYWRYYMPEKIHTSADIVRR